MSGLLTMPAEQYHKAQGVSRSMLDWIHPPKTPMHYRARWITGEIEEEETPAMRLGTLTHRLVLEEESCADAFHVKPEGMNFASKEGKAWKESHDDRTIITTAEYNAMLGMRQAVRGHKLASRLLKRCDYERSAFAECDGLLLKARFDAIPIGGNAIVDLKTCEAADLDSVERSMEKRLYYRQAAFYLKIAELLGLGLQKFIFIFVEKNPPYAVATYELPDAVLRAGEMTVNRDLALLRDCMERDQWPGYGDDLQVAGLPMFAMKRLEAVL